MKADDSLYGRIDVELAEENEKLKAVNKQMLEALISVQTYIETGEWDDTDISAVIKAGEGI